MLTALTAFANVDLSDDKEDNRGNFLLQALSLVFCLIFTFSFLLKTDFGLLEWQLLALLTTALTILTFFRRQTYLPLLAATQAVIFILLATWYTPDTAQKTAYFCRFCRTDAAAVLYCGMDQTVQRIYRMAFNRRTADL